MLSIHNFYSDVDTVPLLQQQGCKVCLPPQVRARQRKKHVECAKVIQLGQQLKLVMLPELDCVWDGLQATEFIPDLIGNPAISCYDLLSAETNQGDVLCNPLFLQVGNYSKEVGRVLGKPLLHIQNSLDKIPLVS